MKPKILLDMDGVLSDFASGALMVNGLPPDKSILARDYYAGVGEKIFWNNINLAGPEFWSGLPKTIEAEDIVSLAVSYVGKDNIAIATSPSDSNLANCLWGKQVWMRRHFPALAENMIFVNNKNLLASPYHLLIDDQDNKVNRFYIAGGRSTLVPRPWNSRAPLEDHLLTVLNRGIESFLENL